jgi:hypothetical protein
MKKFFLLGAVALMTVALSQQQASAWVNSRGFIGIGWSYTSGNNSCLWGLWRNGQIPPYPTDVNPSFCFGSAPNSYASYGPFCGSTYGGAYDHAQMPATPPAPSTPVGTGTQSVQYQSWYGNAAYQPVNYSYQPNPYGYYQAPSYWYGW